MLAHDPVHIFSKFINANIHTLNLDNDYKPLMRFLVLWPLQLACSIPTKRAHATFHAEYIIPQLLMQYIQTVKEVDGIGFRTTRVPLMHPGVTHAKGPVIVNNYVFPSKQSQATGFCNHLASMFALTSPYSWELLQSCPITDHDKEAAKQELFDRFGREDLDHGDSQIGISDDNSATYDETGFGMMEKRIITFGYKRMFSNDQ